ncbi:hypothetical protein E5329_05135 [Petralouisia muris]|uniref:Uncharacterized protein n=1 Tax=Petralouisia muris TaxID=3032872 RepID=A0AC61S0D1_9FIRM|nr:hypothetical protein [Petralouisia muris]TGY97295.1 hypothetical protein E5329_05135 [Petralouisia muris]
MKVLFSAIGSTDPISNCADGGMLHICRVYHPDKIYLYLSKEMCKYHDMDDRYCKAVRLLEEEMEWQCEIEVIRDETMENVQIFDAFIISFEKIISAIREKDQPEQLYLNVSSGTPAMKCSLQIISMLWNNIQAIQVSTPQKSSNKYHEDKDSYDLAVQWECNEDRKEGFENRCSVSDAKYLLDRIRKENIHKYLEVYDYEAAKMMANTLSVQPSKQFLDCLNLAIERNRLNLKFVNGMRGKCQVSDWFPIVQDREMKEYEYMLSMQTKLWKRQYMDFIRDITPIFFSLSEKVLKKYCKLRFEDIGKKNREGVFCLSLDKLRTQKIKPQERWGNHTNISSFVIFKIMEQKCKEERVLELMKNIRTVEREVRNLAAHEIVGVTKGWIKNRTKFEPEQIMDMLFTFGKYAGLDISAEDRKIYNTMNEHLWELL